MARFEIGSDDHVIDTTKPCGAGGDQKWWQATTEPPSDGQLYEIANRCDMLEYMAELEEENETLQTDARRFRALADGHCYWSHTAQFPSVRFGESNAPPVEFSTVTALADALVEEGG